MIPLPVRSESPPSVMPRASMRRYRFATGAIILAALAAYLLGNWSVNLWDRDEAWYAQASKQMLESGNWTVPYFLDQPRYAKPILIYWCQAASMKVLGSVSWEMAARLPSTIGMTATLVLLAIVLGRTLGPRRAMYTVLIFASSGMIIVSAKMCLTDSVLMVFMTTAQFCVFAVYWLAGPRRPLPFPWTAAEARHVGYARDARSDADEDGSPDALETQTAPKPGIEELRMEHKAGAAIPPSIPVLLWVAIGLAGLTKGPFILAILLSTMVALALFDVGKGNRCSPRAWLAAVRWWRCTRPLLGVLIVTVLTLPWLIAAYLRDPQFLFNLVQEPWRHASAGQDNHSGFPGYYFAFVWPCFFPWSLFLVTALLLGWKHRRTPHVRFALATILGNWIVAEVMRTKLPHYILPSFSSLAFLTATALIRCQRRQHDDLHRRLTTVAAGIFAVITIIAALLISWFAAVWFDDIPRAAATTFTLWGVLFAGAVFWLLFRRRIAATASAMAIGMAGVVVILYGFYFPRASFLRAPSQVAARLRELGATGEGQVIMTDYAEPSVAFYQGGTIRPREKNFLRETPPESWPRWIVTSAKGYERLDRARRDRLRLIDTFKALNYNDGFKRVDVLILENTSAKPRAD